MYTPPPRRFWQSNELPPFRRSGTIAFLDDDREFLELLTMALPRNWLVRPFESPRRCVDALAAQIPDWEREIKTYQDLLRDFAGDMQLLSQVIDFWSNDPARWARVDGLVADYIMPDLNGVEVLHALRTWPGFKIMLTGGREEVAAIEAFNAGALDRYQRKDSAANPFDSLKDILEQLRYVPQPTIAQIWLSALPADALAALDDAETKRLIAEATADLAEFVMLGEPLGIVGSTADGEVSFLQLELLSDLEFLVDVGRDAHMSAEELNGIREGALLPDVGAAFALDRKPVARPARRLGQFVGAKTPLVRLPLEATLAHHLKAASRRIDESA